MSNILCTICARGGSKGVKNKNIKELNGKPLIAYTIEQAKDSNLFEHIVISTDSDDIANIAKKYGAEVFFKRSEEMATDTAGKLDVIRDAFKRSEEYYNRTFDYLIDLDATAPLRSVEDIIDSFNQFKENNNDNLITAMPSRRSPYFNLVEQDENGKVYLSKKLDNKIIRRQDALKSYDMNASIYIWKRDIILSKNSTNLKSNSVSISIDLSSGITYSPVFSKNIEFSFKIISLFHI
jgi:CMP-N,N'-diacetyllegionaminic acid synthase